MKFRNFASPPPPTTRRLHHNLRCFRKGPSSRRTSAVQPCVRFGRGTGHLRGVLASTGNEIRGLDAIAAAARWLVDSATQLLATGSVDSAHGLRAAGRAHRMADPGRRSPVSSHAKPHSAGKGAAGSSLPCRCVGSAAKQRRNHGVFNSRLRTPVSFISNFGSRPCGALKGCGS